MKNEMILKCQKIKIFKIHSRIVKKIQQIPSDFVRKSDADLKENEMSKDIDDMKANKTPGPDGLPIGTFVDSL